MRTRITESRSGVHAVRLGLAVLALMASGCVSTRLQVSDDHPARASAAPASPPAAAILAPGAPLYQPDGAAPMPMEGHEHHMPPSAPESPGTHEHHMPHASPPAPGPGDHEHHGEPTQEPPPTDSHEHHKPGPPKAPGKGPGR